MLEKTFNRRITEGILDGTYKTTTRDGVTIYIIERPRPDEEVVGYVPFSGFLHQATPTEIANS